MGQGRRGSGGYGQCGGKQLNGIQEVRGSTPLGSTKEISDLAHTSQRPLVDPRPHGHEFM